MTIVPTKKLNWTLSKLNWSIFLNGHSNNCTSSRFFPYLCRIVCLEELATEWKEQPFSQSTSLLPNTCGRYLFPQTVENNENLKKCFLPPHRNGFSFSFFPGKKWSAGVRVHILLRHSGVVLHQRIAFIYFSRSYDAKLATILHRNCCYVRHRVPFGSWYCAANVCLIWSANSWSYF